MKKEILNAAAPFLFLMLLLGFTSCSNDDEISRRGLEVSPTSIDFEARAGSQQVEVISSARWTISTDADWINLSKRAAPGTSTVTIGVQANPEAVERSAILIIESKGENQEIQVTQEAGDPEPEPDPSDNVVSTIPPDETGIRNLTSVELTEIMGIGWNLGNSLDAVGGETAWGNPMVNKRLIDSVKAAGFNAVRIPVAWSKFSNQSTFEIRETWMNRVEEVVNYVLDNDMYAIINIHWDNGWMQPTYEQEDYVNDRLEIMWQQIAIHFRDYDDKLLFAGTNEVMVTGDYGTPTEEYYTVQNGFNQTFVNTVRETGGRNHYRHLVVQGFNTNIDHTINFVEIPEDVVENRLMMEVHYYDPYDFTLNENSTVYEWGENAANSQSWANESYADNQFERMKTNFIDQGVGVILGEYGAIRREGIEGHEAYREYYMEYITRSAVEHGLVPFYWDNGDAGNHGFALFDRTTGETLYPELVKAIVEQDN